jgi:ubiquinone/menaquinone biosynthesis C-methylase UbiE
MEAYMSTLADKDYVADQYQTATNLNARISLHRRFSTNRYGWFRWLFDRLRFPPQARILELGCGPGDLWRKNLYRIPAGWAITLTDQSAGMVEKAQQHLADSQHSFRFEVVDAQAIPYPRDRFDGVLANHMLYHVPDKARALSEIRRVLKPDGLFYASTIGARHLSELKALAARFDPRLSDWGQRPADDFILEDGAVRLAQTFAEVTLHRYDDDLVVTDPDALIAYVRSDHLAPITERADAFARFVHAAFERRGGTFRITKDSGVFEARGVAQP